MKQQLTAAGRLTLCMLGILMFVLFGMAVNAKGLHVSEPSAQQVAVEMPTEILVD
jgi:hypothetical protein